MAATLKDLARETGLPHVLRTRLCRDPADRGGGDNRYGGMRRSSAGCETPEGCFRITPMEQVSLSHVSVMLFTSVCKAASPSNMINIVSYVV